MEQILIKGTGIKKSFRQGGRENDVLEDVSVSIYEGDFTIVMGSSGAGKSTLLYVLSGMDHLTEGSVRYREQEITKLSERGMARLRAEDFGFVFQQAHLVSNLTLEENILTPGFLAAKAKGRTESQVRVRTRELLAQMGIEGAKDRLPGEASGGEQQRAAVARAVINSPSMLFADEPTGALNRKTSEEVLRLFTDLNEGGQSILMVTHDVRAAIRGNRILYLEDGKVLDELRLAPYEVERAKERKETVNRWLEKLRW
ncbi:MAG: ABC transporter ATP-binding protein [Eubacteriales bacterium]|nr:ABC transporter ATP-binding protein [Eubacteriales bacterium]